MIQHSQDCRKCGQVEKARSVGIVPSPALFVDQFLDGFVKESPQHGHSVDTTNVQKEENEYKMPVIGVTNALIKPVAVMVPLQDTSPARAAVMASSRSIEITLAAV